MADLFAGLDVSTQSCKIVVIRPDDGAVVHVDRVDYDRDLPAYGTLEGATTGLGEGVSESGYRLALNIGDDGGMTIPHLHMHLLGGRRLGPEG